MSTTNDYRARITSEHADKPKYGAMIEAAVSGFVGLQNFLGSLATEFDLDSARWQQLDAIGARVGLDRSLRATAPGVFVQAPPAGVVPLVDSDYQILIRGKIGANQWDGTIAGAYAKLRGMFGNSGSRLFMVDNQDMSITVAVAGAVPSAAFKAALSGGYMQVRPCGVLANYVFPTAPGGPLFGFGVNNEFIAGIGSGVWAAAS
jgi:hypothetical protein